MLRRVTTIPAGSTVAALRRALAADPSTRIVVVQERTLAGLRFWALRRDHVDDVLGGADDDDPVRAMLTDAALVRPSDTAADPTPAGPTAAGATPAGATPTGPSPTGASPTGLVVDGTRVLGWSGDLEAVWPHMTGAAAEADVADPAGTPAGPAGDGPPRARSARRGGLFPRQAPRSTSPPRSKGPSGPPTPADGPPAAARPPGGVPRSRGPVARSPRRRGAALPPPTAPSPASGLPPAPPAQQGADPPEATVEAYARVDAPPRVTVGDDFAVEVGVGPEPMADVVVEAAMLLPRPLSQPDDPSPPIELQVQVGGHGLAFPEGMRRTLRVDPDDLSATSTSFAVRALPTDTPRLATLEVDYSVGGQPVGRAWRTVLVAAGGDVPDDDVRVPPPGGTSIRLQDYGTADLNITVSESRDGAALLWTFTTPHELDLPDEQVETRLDAASAQQFAIEVVSQMVDDRRGPVEMRVAGISETIAGQLPRAAHDLVAATLRTARAEGRTPSLLVTSSDPWVPWELASLAHLAGEDGVLDPQAPALLGAQFAMGRWVLHDEDRGPPREHPAAQPGEELDLHCMAVAVGTYDPLTSRQKALPEAQAEAATLTARYPAVALAATLEDLEPLLLGRLPLPDGLAGPVDMVHIASHGKLDPHDADAEGIVLQDGQRLSALTIRGGRLGEGRPLVFLNACQLGGATRSLLGDCGGLAAAFLAIGSRAVVAPLWSVDDEVARGIAEDFYRLCVDEGQPVGEAMRRTRARWDDDRTATTPLAYVFYGHPNLTHASTDADDGAT